MTTIIQIINSMVLPARLFNPTLVFSPVPTTVAFIKNIIAHHSSTRVGTWRSIGSDRERERHAVQYSKGSTDKPVFRISVLANTVLDKTFDKLWSIFSIFVLPDDRRMKDERTLNVISFVTSISPPLPPSSKHSQKHTKIIRLRQRSFLFLSLWFSKEVIQHSDFASSS